MQFHRVLKSITFYSDEKKMRRHHESKEASVISPAIEIRTNKLNFSLEPIKIFRANYISLIFTFCLRIVVKKEKSSLFS